MALNLAGDFIWNEAELQRLLKSQHGAVARDLSRRLVRCVNQAKRNASTPRGNAVPNVTGPSVDTGRLRSSISWRLGEDSLGLYGDYGTGVPYGYWLETGLVNGTKYPFLLPALPAAGP